MLLERLDIDAAEFEAATGWEIKPDGACQGDICVPLGGGEFDLVLTAERLGMALVHDQSEGVSALGPATLNGTALSTAVAPDITLHDLDGNDFRLSSLRGQKVVIVSWAPY